MYSAEEFLGLFVFAILYIAFVHYIAMPMILDWFCGGSGKEVFKEEPSAIENPIRIITIDGDLV